MLFQEKEGTEFNMTWVRRDKWKSGLGMLCAVCPLFRVLVFTLFTLGSGVDLRRSKVYMLRTPKNMMYGVKNTEVVSILFHSISVFFPLNVPFPLQWKPSSILNCNTPMQIIIFSILGKFSPTDKIILIKSNCFYGFHKTNRMSHWSQTS